MTDEVRLQSSIALARETVSSFRSRMQVPKVETQAAGTRSLRVRDWLTDGEGHARLRLLRLQFLASVKSASALRELRDSILSYTYPATSERVYGVICDPMMLMADDTY